MENKILNFLNLDGGHPLIPRLIYSFNLDVREDISPGLSSITGIVTPFFSGNRLPSTYAELWNYMEFLAEVIPC